jgi:hypothetical protein
MRFVFCSDVIDIPDLSLQSYLKLEGRGICAGYHVPESSIAVPLANISNDYNEDDAEIEFCHNNGNRVRISLHPTRPIRFSLSTSSTPPRSPSTFRKLFPLDLVIVPRLAPFEEVEPYLQDETIQRNESSRLASRYFRNIWHRKSDAEFAAFKELEDIKGTNRPIHSSDAYRIPNNGPPGTVSAGAW